MKMSAFHNVYRISAICSLCLLIVAPRCFPRDADKQLAVIEGGVQRSENAPFAPRDFEFLPGEYVYFTFHIAGFTTSKNPATEVKSFSLSFEVTPQDANHIPLAETAKGDITGDLSNEDKNWTPKRRAAFLLPSYVAAGDFHIHVVVRDLIAKTETSRDYAFKIGGIRIAATPAIQVQSFEFLRNEEDSSGLEIPAYSAGDTVWARFQMTGFQNETGNRYKLAYGIKVVRPDGKNFLDNPKAAQISAESFYPAQFIPGQLQITTPKNAVHGAYALTLIVHDEVSNQSFEVKRSFSIE